MFCLLPELKQMTIINIMAVSFPITSGSASYKICKREKGAKTFFQCGRMIKTTLILTTLYSKMPIFIGITQIMEAGEQTGEGKNQEGNSSLPPLAPHLPITLLSGNTTWSHINLLTWTYFTAMAKVNRQYGREKRRENIIIN